MSITHSLSKLFKCGSSTLVNATLFSVIRVSDLDSNNNRNGCYNSYCNYDDHSVIRNGGCCGSYTSNRFYGNEGACHQCRATVSSAWKSSQYGHCLLQMVFGMIVVMKVVEVFSYKKKGSIKYNTILVMP